MFSQDEVDTALVSAKTRMAPLKPMSIPSLELQAAVMGSRLAQTIKSQQSLKLDSITLWTDSRTVLSWIRADAHQFRPFVAHRIGEIGELTNVSEWRWILTGLNVADDASQGFCASELSRRWLNGPDFFACR